MLQTKSRLLSLRQVAHYEECHTCVSQPKSRCLFTSTNTGAPQGTVVLLAPFLFALYTADCRSIDESCPLVKFADDTELVGKISNDDDAPQAD